MTSTAFPPMESISAEPETPGAAARRRLLVVSAGLLGAAATGLLADILVTSMNPGRDVAAEGAPVDVDVSRIESGQLIVAEWKKKPVWILRRDESMLAALADQSLLARLRDPESKAPQQPSARYVNGNFRALKPEFFVAVALCTHLQCVPEYVPEPHTVTPWWRGGFHCPCHGSIYDLSARVFEGSPAPLNIPIPPYYWRTATVVRIGEGDAHGLDEDWNAAIW